MDAKQCPSCGLQKPRTNFSKNKTTKDGLQSWCKDCINNQKLFREYGITKDQYDILLESQNYKCKICGIVNSGRSDKGRLLVDHDHKTGRVRGLLCHPCNAALGLLKDDEKTISKALEYIRSSKE